MAVSKVVLGDETLVDLTSDTVSEDTLLEGTTAHGANGEEVIGGVVVTPMYTGTKSAIEEAIALGQITEDAVVNITDDEETSSFQTQIDEINSSLTNENSETFNFGVLNGVRGFFTNPSRADDSFIPFSGIEEIFFNTSFLEQFDKSMSLKKGVAYELYIHTACNANGSNNVAVSKTSGTVNITEEILNKNGQSGFSTCTVKYMLNNITEDSIINARVVNASASLVKVNAFAILLKA